MLMRSHPTCGDVRPRVDTAMRPRDKKTAPSRPAVDEWGIYDPEQAGLAAVIERIAARRKAALDAADDPPAAPTSADETSTSDS